MMYDMANNTYDYHVGSKHQHVYRQHQQDYRARRGSLGARLQQTQRQSTQLGSVQPYLRQVLQQLDYRADTNPTTPKPQNPILEKKHYS